MPDPANASLITQCGGIPLIIECLSSPVNLVCVASCQVNYALGAIYYLCNTSNKEEIMKPEVVDVINKYAVAESVSFSNLSKAILDKHLSNRN
ncbi:hypothetical protein Csa_019933 [Cucumis sativus]|nr:hypothetical protein Csa_019933 [Cucumis sativus]